MLSQLTLSNLGPVVRAHLGFGRRVNVITGENGLGKTFLLDLAWLSLTRTPITRIDLRNGEPGQLEYRQTGRSGKWVVDSGGMKDLTEEQDTSLNQVTHFVVYASVDGAVHICDPTREVRRASLWDSKEVISDSHVRSFSQSEIWSPGLAKDNSARTAGCSQGIREKKICSNHRRYPFPPGLGLVRGTFQRPLRQGFHARLGKRCCESLEAGLARLWRCFSLANVGGIRPKGTALARGRALY